MATLRFTRKQKVTGGMSIRSGCDLFTMKPSDSQRLCAWRIIATTASILASCEFSTPTARECGWTMALRGEPLTIYGEGDQTRSFCFVSDLVDGIYRLLLSDEHNPVNIGNPFEITIREFAETINRITGNPAGIVQKTALRLGDDPQRRRPNITRAKEILKWEPKISLEEGIRLTIPYFKEKMGLA
jgi:hypothetical protein